MTTGRFAAKWLLLLFVMLPTLHAQDTTPVFEVASIRVASECSNFSMSPPNGNQFYLLQAPMVFLLGMAYKVEARNIRINQKDLDSKCFDIRAKGQNETKLSEEDSRRGLQQLLTERFALRFHREKQEQSGYDLEVDGAGIPLPPSKGGQATGTITLTTVHARNFPMHSLATVLAIVLKEPVADQTHLSGNYDIDLKFSSDAASADDAPSIFQVLQQQLGLRLKRAKVAVNLFVVDSIRQEPTDEMSVGS